MTNQGVNNFAIPGARLAEVRSLTEKKGPSTGTEQLFKVILNGEGTEVQQARAKQPDFMIVWAGNNDALDVITTEPFGIVTDKLLTPAKDFEKEYAALITDLIADYEGGAKKGSHPQLIVANIPDVSVIPHLFPLGKPVGEIPFGFDVSKFVLDNGGAVLTKTNVEQLSLPLDKFGEKNAEHPAGSYVGFLAMFSPSLNPPGSGKNPLFDSLKAGERRFTNDQVFSPDELQTISKRITEYNQIIDKICTAQGIPVVDVNSLLATIKTKGYTVGQTNLTATFTGGIFSFDAIHPTRTGYGIIAQTFLDVMNKQIAQKPFGFLQQPIASIDLKAVMKDDYEKPQG
jgi:hypothetical protein